MNAYTIGTLIRLSGMITASDGTVADPSAVSIRVKLPGQTTTNVSAVKDSAGNYHGDFLPTMLGLHMYQIIGTGTVQAAALSQFIVTQETF